jgi:hypothetical protein
MRYPVSEAGGRGFEPRRAHNPSDESKSLRLGAAGTTTGLSPAERLRCRRLAVEVVSGRLDLAEAERRVLVRR